MPRPDDSSRPQLCPGCRWAEESEDRVLLFPEGLLRPKATATAILERCNGALTVADIVHELQQQYTASDPQKIREDVFTFLDQLQRKCIVEFR